MIGIKACLILAIRGISANSHYQHYPDATSIYATPTDSAAYTTTTVDTYPTDSYDTATSSIDYTTDSANTSVYPTDIYATDTSAYPTDVETSTTDSPYPYPTETSSSCPGSNYNQVNITSPDTITAGQEFTIAWTSPQPDLSKNHTEARVELWALNAGPVNSPLLSYKSDRFFDTSSYTYNFPASYANATTKGGPVIWQLFVAVYSTYFSSNATDLESWNLPYYGVQKVKFE